MNSRVVDRNADVVAARRMLRVAATVPTFAALICGVAALLVFALAERKWFALVFLAGVAVFASVARHVERGDRWAMWFVTVLVAAVSAVEVLALIGAADGLHCPDRGSSSVRHVLAFRLARVECDETPRSSCGDSGALSEPLGSRTRRPTFARSEAIVHDSRDYLRGRARASRIGDTRWRDTW